MREIAGEIYVEIIILNNYIKSSFEIAFEVWMHLKQVWEAISITIEFLKWVQRVKGAHYQVTWSSHRDRCGIVLYHNLRKGFIQTSLK